MTRTQKLAGALVLTFVTAGGVATVEGKKVSAELDRSVKGCVRAPLDGGTDCLRQVPRTKLDATLGDNEARYFGAGNCFPKREAVGAQCETMALTTCAGGE